MAAACPHPESASNRRKPKRPRKWPPSLDVKIQQVAHSASADEADVATFWLSKGGANGRTQECPADAFRSRGSGPADFDRGATPMGMATAIGGAPPRRDKPGSPAACGRPRRLRAAGRHPFQGLKTTADTRRSRLIFCHRACAQSRKQPFAMHPPRRSAAPTGMYQPADPDHQTIGRNRHNAASPGIAGFG